MNLPARLPAEMRSTVRSPMESLGQGSCCRTPFEISKSSESQNSRDIRACMTAQLHQQETLRGECWMQLFYKLTQCEASKDSRETAPQDSAKKG